MNKIILFIILFLITSKAQSQHIIITTNNDSIEAQILNLSDSIYTYKRLQKPRKESTINIKLVKQLIAFGDDTLFNTFMSERFIKYDEKPMVNITPQIDETKTQAYWLYKSGEYMNSAITLNIIGVLCIAASPILVQYDKKVNKVFISSTNTFEYTTIEPNFTASYISLGIGMALNIASIVSWYQCSESLKEASKQQRFSFKVSPTNANVAFKF